MIPAKEFYNLISRDSMTWLDNSEKLKLSADIIHNELQKSVGIFLNGEKDYNNEDKIQALWNTYYLLIGHAFENLIKGLSIESNRQLKSFNEIFNIHWKKNNSGHGISKIAQDNIMDLTNKEIEILEKLETYILWAGKYPLPKREDIFFKEENRLIYDTNDFNRIGILFERIKTLLLQKWDNNEYK